MPHLTIEYSANLAENVEMQAFCMHMRDAMVESGIFPLGGIRIRAFPCETYVIADGAPEHAYLHMMCRVGHGRDEQTRLNAADGLYSAAEAFLAEKTAARPFALSLDFAELDPVTSIKRHNTLHAHLKQAT